MSQKPEHPFKKVAVEWADAYSIDGWHPVTELQAMIDHPPDHPDGAVGFLVAENKDWIVLSNATALEGGAWSGAASLAIPRGMIRKLEVVGAPRGERRGKRK